MTLVRFYLVLLALLLPALIRAQDVPLEIKLPPSPLEETGPDDERLAVQYMTSKEFDKAIELFEKIYKKKPQQYIYNYLFYCYLESGDTDGAEKLARNAMRKNPGDPSYQVDLGFVYTRQGKPEKSKEIYEEALQNLPPSQDMISRLANAFEQRYESQYAILTYQKGRELLNYSYTYGFELASLYDRLGDYPNMLEEYFSLIRYSPAFLSQVQNRLQFFLENDPESTRSEIVRKSLLTKVQKEPDQPLFSEMLIWFSMQQKNFSLALTQAKSLFRRFGESGERIYDLGKLAAANGDYDNALDAFGFIVEKGPSQPFYVVCRLEFLNTRFMKITGSLLTTREELLQLEKDFEVEIGRQYENVQHAMLIRNLAHLETFYLKNREKGMLLLEKLIENPSLPSKSLAESKLELADIYLFSGEVWEATLLYQQVYKAFQNDELGQMAKYRNAKLSFYIGEFDWARVQLDVLRAATSKLIANDAMALSLLISENLDIDSSYGALSLYAKADLLAFRHEYDSVIYFLDAIPAQYGWHSLLDDALFRKAEIHAAKGEYLIADSLYAAVNATYPDDLLADDALLRRAQLQESVFKNKEKAMVFYQDLFIKYPSSLYASDARKRFRILRGDPIE